MRTEENINEILEMIDDTQAVIRRMTELLGKGNVNPGHALLAMAKIIGTLLEVEAIDEEQVRLAFEYAAPTLRIDRVQ